MPPRKRPPKSTKSTQSPQPSAKQRRVHTAETDARIEELFALHGAKWRKIAADFGDGCTDDVVRNRFVRVRNLRGEPLKPTVARRPPKRPEVKRLWSPEEDSQLLELVNQGVGILDLCEHFPGRKRQSIRNRKYRLLNTKLENVRSPVQEGETSDLTYMLSCISDACVE